MGYEPIGIFISGLVASIARTGCRTFLPGNSFCMIESGGPDAMLATYQQVYDDIARVMAQETSYDLGSYGPIFVRLAWHTSGTYNKTDGTGGSNKATMRFDPEASHEANKGLSIARDKLQTIKQQHLWISHGDLWTLAGSAAIQQMGGPVIPWRPGRIDGNVAESPPDGRLPDAANNSSQHLRDVFYRMGFNDQEIAALAGAHTLGKCHIDRSGFDGEWTANPIQFSNAFHTDLLSKLWVERNWTGNKQFTDNATGLFLMLPSDLALRNDTEFRKSVELYARDENKFFQDFALAWVKLIELGVPFQAGAPVLRFRTYVAS